MDISFNQKVVLITGAGQGIGFGIAEAFVKNGARVILNDQRADVLEKASQALGGHVLMVQGDVTDPAACDGILNFVRTQAGRLDVLVCNVGSGRSVAPGSETFEEWQRVLALNLFSTTNMVEKALPALARTKGAVVCISSICGIDVLGAPVTYSAAKAAVNAFVKGISRPFAKQGVRINAVAPGNVLFEGSVWELKLRENAGAVHSMLEREVAMQRLGTTAEVADAVMFLASERATFITGHVLVVDGGQVR